MKKTASIRKDRLRLAGLILAAAGMAILAAGTVRNPDFWTTADERGEALFHKGDFAGAAKTFVDPWRIGIAQFRSGSFEAAAKTFARVPGADGAFNQGNAWLMHGAYEQAIASYDRALGFHHGWKEAEENKALAIARKSRIDQSDKNRAAESTNAYEPDKIVFDLKGSDKSAQPEEMNEQNLSDEDVRASWLRRVQTTPGDFLRAKFAFQAAHGEGKKKEAEEKEGGGK